jgi:hypothetical protein
LLPTTVAQNNAIAVQGRVIVGTTNGSPLPEGLQLELQLIDSASVQSTATYSTTLESDGSFTFSNVPPIQGNDFYLIYTTYNGFRQSTRPFQSDQANNIVFHVYETTDQLDDIVITNGIMQIEEFAFLRDSGVNIEVILELEVENRGDHILYNGSAAFYFELIVGAYGYSEVTTQGSTATHLRFEDGIIPIVKDTIPLIPDWPSRTIRVSYLLEYNEGAVIDMRFPVPVENFELLVPKDTVELKGDTMRATGEERPGIGSNITYRLYRQLNTIQPDESLIFSLEGRPTETITNDPITALRNSEDDKQGASISTLFGGFLGITLIFGGVWWLWRRRKMSSSDLFKGENSELS